MTWSRANWVSWEKISPTRSTSALLRMNLLDAVKIIDGESPAHKPIQICPQNGVFSRQPLTEDLIINLKNFSPDRVFYLHANHQLNNSKILMYDAGTIGTHWEKCFLPLSELSKILNCPIYSIHSGRKIHSSPNEIITNVLKLEKLFNCRIAIEGMYPSKRDNFNISTSAEYRWLLKSGLSMAIDVSHLNIVRNNEIGFDDTLLSELLFSDQCVEVHISDNDGVNDSHRALPKNPPWWWKYICEVIQSRPNLPIFCESVN